MSMSNKIALALVCCGIISTASSATLSNQTITKVGAQGGNAYIYLAANPSPACLYNVIYVKNIDLTVGKVNYMAVLSGYMAGKVATRIDYNVLVDNTCQLTLVEF